MSTERRPAINPEVRELEMISMAMDNAEKQLREGTASSQVITHFLKLAATREQAQLELEKMKLENELTRAKTEAIKESKKQDELFAEAMRAFAGYSGSVNRND